MTKDGKDVASLCDPSSVLCPLWSAYAAADLRAATIWSAVRPLSSAM